MKSAIVLSFVLVAVSFISISHVDAGCAWFGGCWTGSWYIDNIVTTTTREPFETVTASNKGCDYDGEPSPTGHCNVTTRQVSVFDWRIEGDVSGSIYGQVNVQVGANVGQATTVEYAGTSGHDISGFCQTCRTEAGRKYERKNYTIKCTCGNTTKNGSVIQFKQFYVDATTGLQNNPPCNPSCPG
jgi:hypothetical protein